MRKIFFATALSLSLASSVSAGGFLADTLQDMGVIGGSEYEGPLGNKLTDSIIRENGSPVERPLGMTAPSQGAAIPSSATTIFCQTPSGLFFIAPQIVGSACGAWTGIANEIGYAVAVTNMCHTVSGIFPTYSVGIASSRCVGRDGQVGYFIGQP